MELYTNLVPIKANRGQLFRGNQNKNSEGKLEVNNNGVIVFIIIKL
jgi:hypothetical protein